MSNRRFKKGTFFVFIKSQFLFFYQAIFAHFLPKTDFLLSDHLF